jgi:hypothetical protein
MAGGVIGGRSVAHEIGHRFSLKHYSKEYVRHSAKLHQNQLHFLPDSEYAESNIFANAFYLKLRYVKRSDGAYALLDQVARRNPDFPNPLVDVCDSLSYSLVTLPSEAPINTILTGHVVYFCTPSPLGLPTDLTVEIYRRNTLMTHQLSKLLDSRIPADHHFSTDNPNDISLIQIN